MDEERELQLIASIKQYIADNLVVARLSDEELEAQIEAIEEMYLQGQYIPIEKRVSIVEQVYSSIRGLGLLDTIMKAMPFS